MKKIFEAQRRLEMNDEKKHRQIVRGIRMIEFLLIVDIIIKLLKL